LHSPFGFLGSPARYDCTSRKGFSDGDLRKIDITALSGIGNAVESASVKKIRAG
jgi:hypothetical protein